MCAIFACSMHLNKYSFADILAARIKSTILKGDLWPTLTS